MERLDPGLYRAARAILAEFGKRSPVFEIAAPNQAEQRCLIKAEALQETGSFKFRSAYVALSLLSDEERERGVVAYSSGNFGAGLSAAGQLLHVPVLVVVPHDAPEAKLRLIRRGGAKVVLVDPGDENREDYSARYAAELAEITKSTLLHPFEDERLLAGHAALVGEFLEEAKEMGHELSHLYVPCGGAGLASAAAWAVQLAGTKTTVVAVEPANYPTLGLSLAQGHRVRVAKSKTLCDALQASQVGELAFSILQGGRCQAMKVADELVLQAMSHLLRERKIVAEPSAALGLAGFLSQEGPVAQRVGVIVTGGNIQSSVLRLVVGLEHEGERDALRTLGQVGAE